MISHSKPYIGKEEADAVLKTLEAGRLSAGAGVAELEENIKTTTDYNYVLAVSSATQGMALALKCMFDNKVRVGVSSYVCRALYDAVCMAGHEPVLLDIAPSTFTIAPAEAINAKVDCVIIAPMFGVQAPIEEFTKAGIPVIEDLAQRVPPYENFSTEPSGLIKVLSMDATKVFTAGEGGVFLTNDDTIGAMALNLSNADYSFNKPALKITLTDVQAAIGNAQWKKLPIFLERRRQIAGYYINRLREAGLDAIIHQAMLTDATYHFRFIVKVSNPVAYIEAAEPLGVSFRRPVAPVGLHQLFNAEGDFKNTEDALATNLSLPLYPALTLDEQEQVINVFIALYEKLS